MLIAFYYILYENFLNKNIYLSIPRMTPIQGLPHLIVVPQAVDCVNVIQLQYKIKIMSSDLLHI